MFRNKRLVMNLEKVPKGVELKEDEEDGIDRIAHYVVGTTTVIKHVMILGITYVAADTVRQILVKRLSK